MYNGHPCFKTKCNVLSIILFVETFHFDQVKYPLNLIDKILKISIYVLHLLKKARYSHNSCHELRPANNEQVTLPVRPYVKGNAKYSNWPLPAVTGQLLDALEEPSETGPYETSKETLNIDTDFYLLSQVTSQMYGKSPFLGGHSITDMDSSELKKYLVIEVFSFEVGLLYLHSIIVGVGIALL